jgi:hypothetical protein
MVVVKGELLVDVILLLLGVSLLKVIKLARTNALTR